MADKDYAGAFTRWAGKKIPSGVKNFSNWAYSEATSHPIDRLVTAMNTGKLPAAQRKEVFPSDTEPYKASPKPGSVRIPEMLKSKYYRPGAKNGG
jgi:hypothetical protein